MDINRIMKTEQNMIYISEMRSVFNREALFSDTTEFIQVVQEAHKRGMRVILNGVFNH